VRLEITFHRVITGTRKGTGQIVPMLQEWGSTSVKCLRHYFKSMSCHCLFLSLTLYSA